MGRSDDTQERHEYCSALAPVRAHSVQLLGSLTIFTTMTSIAVPALAEPAVPPPSAPSPDSGSVPSAPESKVDQPASGQTAGATPSHPAIPITATCSLGDRYGVDEAEARTAADIVCHELARRGATHTQHEVRFGRLGSRTMVTLASRSGDAYDERRALVTGLDEVGRAGPRLAAALVEGRPLDETRTVDNVLSSEATTTRVQRGASVLEGSLFGLSSLNASGGISAGVAVGFSYRADRLGIGAHGRAGGIGSGDEKISLASLDVGGRYYLSSRDVAPFVGAGLGLGHFALARRGSADVDGSGLNAFADIGVEALRTHHVGLSTSLRVDVPFFSLEGSEGAIRPGVADAAALHVTRYVLPISVSVGLIFH